MALAPDVSFELKELTQPSQTQSSAELLQAIYQDYLPSDQLPKGVEIKSAWGSLVIQATALGKEAVMMAFFDEDLELKDFSSPFGELKEVLVNIRQHQIF